MAGMNPYDLNPQRIGNGNSAGTQNVMPQSNVPVSGTTTSSYSTLQNVMEGSTGAGVNQLGVPPQTQMQAQMQTQPGLLASQMRSRATKAAPAVQNRVGMSPQSMQTQTPSLQKQAQPFGQDSQKTPRIY